MPATVEHGPVAIEGGQVAVTPGTVARTEVGDAIVIDVAGADPISTVGGNCDDACAGKLVPVRLMTVPPDSGPPGADEPLHDVGLEMPERVGANPPVCGSITFSSTALLTRSGNGA